VLNLIFIWRKNKKTSILKLISKISKTEYSPKERIFKKERFRSFASNKLLIFVAVIFIGLILGLKENIVFSQNVSSGPLSLFSQEVSLSYQDYQKEDATTLLEGKISENINEGVSSCINNTNIVENLAKKEENSHGDQESSGEKNIRREAVDYFVQPGDTLSTIAERFGIKTETILWANNLDYLSVIKPGDKLTIPPEDGVIYKVQAGDTLIDIAVRYKADLDKIVAYNQLDANYIVEGQVLFIPDGIKPAPQPTSYLASSSSPSQPSNSSYSSSLSSQQSYSTYSSQPTIRYGGGSNRFPYGYCTWYVAQRRGGVPWSGNAGEWLANARAYGYATGSEPVPGAIMVTRESWWGHVAYVESVSGDYVTISEMNYQGYGIVSRRTLNKNDWRIRGYIY